MKDMAAIDQSRTPWLIFIGPMYSSNDGNIVSPSVDDKFVQVVEPLLLGNEGNPWSLVRISEFGYTSTCNKERAKSRVTHFRMIQHHGICGCVQYQSCSEQVMV